MNKEWKWWLFILCLPCPTVCTTDPNDTRMPLPGGLSPVKASQGSLSSCSLLLLTANEIYITLHFILLFAAVCSCSSMTQQQVSQPCTVSSLIISPMNQIRLDLLGFIFFVRFLFCILVQSHHFYYHHQHFQVQPAAVFTEIAVKTHCAPPANTKQQRDTVSDSLIDSDNYPWTKKLLMLEITFG